MKRITKWLISAPIAATAVTPVVCLSSCGAKEQEVIDMYAFTSADEFKPTFKSLADEDPEPMTQLTSTTAYVAHMKNHPDDFKQDMTYFANDFAYTLASKVTTFGALTTCEFGFGKPTFGKTTIWSFGFEPDEVDTISFKQKIHLVYNKPAVGGDALVKKDFSITVEYKDLVFRCFEYFGGGNKDGWTTGIIDKTLGDEAFWIHQYNSNPWSISYSCIDETTKIIPGVEGKPTVEIKNCRYYSGLIDNADKLYNLWEYRKSSQSIMENCIIDIILMRNARPSYYFAHDGLCVKNIPDISLVEQMNVETPVNKTNIAIGGLHFINKFGSTSHPTAKLALNEDLILNENTTESDARTMTIKKNAEVHIFKETSTIKIGAVDSTDVVLSEGYPAVTPTYRSFTINLKTLPIELTLEDEPYPITLYLHYNSIKVYVR